VEELPQPAEQLRPQPKSLPLAVGRKSSEAVVPPTSGLGKEEAVARSPDYSLTRSKYSPVRVSILMRSPMLTKAGRGTRRRYRPCRAW